MSALAFDAIRKWGLVKCLDEKVSPLSQEPCEEDVFLEVAEAEVADVPEKEGVEFDVHQSFPEKERLVKLLESYVDVFGEIDDRGMNVPPMSVKVKEVAVRKAQTCIYCGCGRYLGPISSAGGAGVSNHVCKQEVLSYIS